MNNKEIPQQTNHKGMKKDYGHSKYYPPPSKVANPFTNDFLKRVYKIRRSFKKYNYWPVKHLNVEKQFQEIFHQKIYMSKKVQDSNMYIFTGNDDDTFDDKVSNCKGWGNRWKRVTSTRPSRTATLRWRR